jgi:hypothetical protein
MRPVFRIGIPAPLELRPAEGPPEAGEVLIQRRDGSERTALALPPVVDAVLAVGAARGAVSFTLDTTEGVAPGRDLWIGSSSATRDHRVVTEVNATDKLVKVQRPLAHAHAEGAEVISGELSVLLTEDEVSGEAENNVAWWAYEVDGVTYHTEQVWDVVLRHFYVAMTPSRLSRYVATQLLEQTTQSVPELLEQANWVVAQYLRYNGIRPDWVVDTTEFERAVGLQVRMLLLAEEAQYSAQRLSLLVDLAQPEFEAEWKILMRNSPRWLDRNVNVRVDPDEVTPIGLGRPVDEPFFGGLP